MDNKTMENNFRNTQIMLSELALINKKYESIAKATGSDYNIFQVLRIETKEVTTHSRMIADLLNPDGWHGMGSQYLSLFLKAIDIDQPRNPKGVICTAEKNYGPIDDVNIKGGNIDIILEGLDKPLVIENKIYAGDQDKQLLRYYNELDKNCDLFYLTLFGNEPSSASTLGINIEVKIISYNVHILEWLKACHELAIDRPLLRETLKQYINIVKHLTGQSMNDEKNQEIFNFIEENKTSLADLYSDLNSFVVNRLEKLIREVFDIVMNHDKLPITLMSDPALFKHEGSWHCHFKFGDTKKGVIFELKVIQKRLTLWTNGWRWDGTNDTELIEALTKKGMYENHLDSRLSADELAEQVIKGIEACKEYYDSIKPKA